MFYVGDSACAPHPLPPLPPLRLHATPLYVLRCAVRLSVRLSGCTACYIVTL